MTPSELKALRARLNLTEPAFAVYLGVSVAGLRKWIAGTRAPTGAAAQHVRLLARVARECPDLHARLVIEARATDPAAVQAARVAQAAPAQEPREPTSRVPAWLQAAL